MAPRISDDDVAQDRRFIRIIESDQVEAAVGEHAHRWLIRYAAMLVAWRQKACAGAHRINVDTRNQAIFRLREFKFSHLKPRKASEAIDGELTGYVRRHLVEDRKRKVLPVDDPVRAICYQICTSGAPIPKAPQIEKILRGTGKKRRISAAARV